MNIFIPDIYEESIYKVDYKRLYKNNIKVVLFDLDNTLIEADENKANPEIKQLFDNIREIGLNPIIFSNSPKKRIKRIAFFMDAEFVYLACKPLSFKFKRLMKKYNLKNSEVAIIGDQLLTDIKGGNKVGIKTILVKPMSNYDPTITRLNRIREKKLLCKIDLEGCNNYEM